MIETYLPEKPCIRGHVGPRRATTGKCLQCEKSRDRSRHGRSALQFDAAARAAGRLAGDVTYRSRIPCRNGHIGIRYTKHGNLLGWCCECRKAYRKKDYAANKERYARASKRWSDENRTSMHASHKKWNAKNLAKIAAYCRKHKQGLSKATPQWANMEAMNDIYAEARRISVETGIPHQVDHIIPLRGKLVCGLHVENNLRVITKVENLKKSSNF